MDSARPWIAPSATEMEPETENKEGNLRSLSGRRKGCNDLIAEAPVVARAARRDTFSQS